MAGKNQILTSKESLEDVSTLLNEEGDKPKEKKPKFKLSPKVKHILYIVILLVVTAVALFLSLYEDFDGIVGAILSSNWRFLLLIAGLVIFAYLIEAFILFVFIRLYTRRYHYHQAMALSMVGAFYSAVTPGSSGGQIMQVYTLNKQGVEASHGTSIMIMSFIVYQLALISLGAVAVFFQWDLIMSMGDIYVFGVGIPAIPLTILGFALNVLVILGLFLMSYSRKFHNFILYYVIDFLGKIKILKHPDQTRESLRIQVENFKIELRRLISNVPIFILVYICFLIILITKFSVPFFAGIALDGYGYLMDSNGMLYLNSAGQAVLSTGQINVESFFQAVFLSAYHQMTTGLLPTPGSAGVSEYFFNTVFANYYSSTQITTAAQIIWRFMTFHMVVLVAGLVTATYRASPKGQIERADRKTFVTMQFETYELRKATSDTLYQTTQLSRKEIQNKLKKLTPKQKRKANSLEGDKIEKRRERMKAKGESVKKERTKKAKKDNEDNFDTIDIGE